MRSGLSAALTLNSVKRPPPCSRPSRLAPTLVNATLEARFVTKVPARLIGDNAYDSDKLDVELGQRGVELIAPHQSNRKRKTQDGRPLRRDRHRWKVERLFAWLQNFRRIVVRYERNPENFLGMLHLACCLILMRRL